MQKKQSNKLRMLIGVSAYLGENQKIISEVPEMTAAKETLDGIISDINYKFNVSKTALYGRTTDKYSARSETVKHLMALAGGLYAWAAKTGDNEILRASHVSRSELKNIRESEFAPVVKNLTDIAKNKKQQLTGFGVSEELITNLENYLNRYKSSIGRREVSTGVKISAVNSLKELFSDSIQALEVLDKFAEVLKLKHKAFYDEYLNVRRIRNIGESVAGKSVRSKPPAAVSS
ncbi:MAG: hypothetical protein IPM38_03135 [Ignavibacteria bacterium]|nr:hypothetical protein [Ignavibacteria bacterium]